MSMMMRREKRRTRGEAASVIAAANPAPEEKASLPRRYAVRRMTAAPRAMGSRAAKSEIPNVL